MRTKLLLAAAATFLTLNASAASPNADTERVTVVGSQPAQTRMAPFMFDNVQGEYVLEDGRVLTVSGKVAGRTRTLYADLGDGLTEIVHIGKNRFVALGKDMRFAFETLTGKRIPEMVHISTVAGRTLSVAQR